MALGRLAGVLARMAMKRGAPEVAETVRPSYVGRTLSPTLRNPTSQTVPSRGYIGTQAAYHEHEPLAMVSERAGAASHAPRGLVSQDTPDEFYQPFGMDLFETTPRYNPAAPFADPTDIRQVAHDPFYDRHWAYWDPEPPTFAGIDLISSRTPIGPGNMWNTTRGAMVQPPKPLMHDALNWMRERLGKEALPLPGPIPQSPLNMYSPANPWTITQQKFNPWAPFMRTTHLPSSRQAGQVKYLQDAQDPGYHLNFPRGDYPRRSWARVPTDDPNLQQEFFRGWPGSDWDDYNDLIRDNLGL